MTWIWDVPVQDSSRIRDVRVAARTAAHRASLDDNRVAAAELVSTELATNLLKHAGAGRVLVELVSTTGHSRYDTVQILTIDHGPGIGDAAAALHDGYSTGQSLGAGLGTCNRLSDSFDLHSVPGHGTVALARLGPARRPAGTPAPDPPLVGGLTMAMYGEEPSGDAWTYRISGDGRVTMLLADGLGHGPDAAVASDAAVATLHSVADQAPEQILHVLDLALRGTRGAAVAVAQLDRSTNTLRFAGVGNIAARLRCGGRWRNLVSQPGIVGAYRPGRLNADRVECDDDALLVMHSDGLPARWRWEDAFDLDRHDPAVISAVVLRNARSFASPPRDDTTVAVLRTSRPRRQDGAS